jgi:hypothetical protein
MRNAGSQEKTKRRFCDLFLASRIPYYLTGPTKAEPEA